MSAGMKWLMEAAEMSAKWAGRRTEEYMLICRIGVKSLLS
jgi:hypothetical protein